MARINDKLQIYLAGKMSGISFEKSDAWRREIKQQLLVRSMNSGCNTAIINPVDFYNFINVRHQNDNEVMKFDLGKVKTSNIVIVNLDGLNTSIGSCIECYEAYKQDIPVLAFGENNLYDNLHPWIKNCITRYSENKEDIINYIDDFYMV